jgi:D-lactate dehydrogenase
MKTAVFDTHPFERDILQKANGGLHDLRLSEERLTFETASFAIGCKAVCCFANDRLDSNVLEKLQSFGVILVALRSAGYNHVDLEAARRLDMTVVRVPAYSPFAIAEHAVGLLLALNRKIHIAHARIQQFNFSLDGLVGFDLHGKTVGVIGTGRIGKVFAEIMTGFGCTVLAYDILPDTEWSKNRGIRYENLETLLAGSDVISLHLPLTKETLHFINEPILNLMKPSVIVINTSRGGVIKTVDLLKYLEDMKIGGACLDVYENEGELFFRDRSKERVSDPTFLRLLKLNNVVITGHQAFLTNEALQNISSTTIDSLTRFEKGLDLSHVKV